jgi:polyhydroxyalkanoate synthase
VNPVEQLVRAPAAAIEWFNILLTTGDAPVGVTPKDVVWTHRRTTLYRYRSSQRTQPIPVLLVFALINRPHIFDLTRGNSFVEYLLDQGYDVFLLDWGEPGDEDGDLGLDDYVCDALPRGIRETLRACGEDEVTLLGWCIGGTLCAMHAALEPDTPVRNMVLLTTPIDTDGGLYSKWIRRDTFDPSVVTDAHPSVPGAAIDFANKMMKPVTNYWSTYRQLFEGVLAGKDPRDSYQPMAKWVADNPPFPGRAFREWTTWMYQENRLVDGRLELRDRRVDLTKIEQNLLVVTAGADHIAPPPQTRPLLDLVASGDVTHFDRPGGHIGLMAGSKAREEIWPDIVDWLDARSDR